MKALSIVMLLAGCAAVPAPHPSDVASGPAPQGPARAAQRRMVALPVPPKPPVRSSLNDQPAPMAVDEPPVAAAGAENDPVSESITPPQTISVLSAQDIIAAADQARIDALGYIVWSKSQPDNIQHMNTLTDTLNAAVKTMKDHATAPGVYVATDVIEARSALVALRTFLRTKGD